MKPLRVHVGHHFFGCGNIGDDLMMAGFLAALRGSGLRCETTCCILGDVTSQVRRFPQVQWMPASPPNVRRCIEACDVWLGLGDTPFQSVGGTWFIDFLDEQATLCAQQRKPMYFLDVGVHDGAALRHPAVGRMLAQAEGTWARDSLSYQALAPFAPERIRLGGDLAAIWLEPRAAETPRVTPSIGLTLNFEGAARYDGEVLARIAREWAGPRYWLVQEVRRIPGSERDAYERLAPELRSLYEPATPDYASAPVEDLVGAWPAVSHVITSRYHAALVHVFRGARVAIVERELKLASLHADLGLSLFADVGSAFDALAEIPLAEPARLAAFAARASASAAEMFDAWRRRFGMETSTDTNAAGDPRAKRQASVTAARAATPDALRILVVSLDSLGDIVMREPLLASLIDAGHRLTLLVRPGFETVARLVCPHASVSTLPFSPYAVAQDQGLTLLDTWLEQADVASFDVLLNAQFEATYVDAALCDAMPHARHVRLVAEGGSGADARGESIAVAAQEHEWRKSRRLAEALLGPLTQWRRPRLGVPDAARAAAGELLSSIGLAPDRFVACVPAGVANVAEKRMPVELVLEGLAAFHDRHGLPALLIGLPFERTLLEQIAAAAADRGIPARTWIGDAGRPDMLVAVLAGARCYFGIDTGSMHVAAALGKPVLAVFGGGHFPRFTPVATTAFVATQRLPCFGCAWRCWLDEPACITTIAPETIRRGVEWVMEREGVEIDEGAPSDGGLVAKLVHVGERSRERMQALKQVERELVQVKEDASARLTRIYELGAELQDANRDREARLAHIFDVQARLDASEADRDKRLAHIHELQADRDARVAEVGAMALRLDAAIAERDAQAASFAEVEAQRSAALAAQVVARDQIVALEAAQRYREQIGYKGRLGELAVYTRQRLKRAIANRLWRLARGAEPPPLPRITLVTPAYNAASTIADTIESVLRQDYPQLEYIVVDGGSTDATRAIVAAFAARDDLPQRIARFISEPDQGMYDALAKGFALATGEVLGYINADDLLERGALARVGAVFARNPSAEVIYHEDDVLVDGWKFPNVDQPRRVGPWDLMARHILFQDGVFFRRRAYEAVGGVRRDLRVAGDFDLWLRLSSRFRLHRVDGHVSTFRMRKGQLGEDMVRYHAEIDRALADWRRATPAAKRLAWRVRGACARFVRRVRRRLRRRDLFFPIDFGNLPPPEGIAPPIALRGHPRSPVDGAPPERLLFSTRDTRFGERIVTHFFLDERNRAAIAYPPIEPAALDDLYRRHYSKPLDKLIEPPPGTPSPYRQYFGGTRFARRWSGRLARLLLRPVRVSWHDATLEEMLSVVRPLGIDVQRPLRFLDVGCFEGGLLDRLRKETAWRTFGLEPNDRAVAIARDKGHTVWQGRAEHALDALPPDALFDVVFMGQSIEHVDDPLTVLRRLRMLLAPRGLLVLSTPNLDSMQIRWFGPTWAHWHAPYHRYIFSRRSLRALAEQTGMTLARCRSFSHPYWTTMTLMQNWLGLAGVVSHAVPFAHETCVYGQQLTALASVLWNWRGKGDYLFAVLTNGDD